MSIQILSVVFVHSAQLCAITGLPAKYKDPKTNMYFANVKAFKEIRKRYHKSNNNNNNNSSSHYSRH